MVAPDRPDWSLPVEQPVGIAWVEVELVTSSTPGSPGFSTVLAPPGPGLRYRIWGVSFAATANSQAPVVVWVAPASTGQGLAHLGGGGVPSAGTVMLPGGAAGFPNDGIQIWFESPLANQGFRATIYYTVETV